MSRGLPFLSRRRSVLRDPRTIPGLAAWYDASDLASMVVDGSNRVSLFADKSGNSGVNCLCLNGVAGNYAWVPNAAAVQITSDIDLRFCGALNAWTVANVGLVGKWSGTNLSYLFMTTATGLRLYLSSNGVANTTVASAAHGFAAYSSNWVRATWRASDGRVQFFTGSDGVTWTQLGTDQTMAAGVPIYSSTAVVEVGSYENGATATSVTGHIYRAQIYNGIGGTLVFDANFATAAKLATSFTESSANAATVTINTSGATGARICGARDLYMGTVASQPIYLPEIAGASLYSSDFSAGVDGWSVPGGFGVVAGNIDGIGGQDNNLRITAASSGAIADGSTVLALGRKYRIRGSVYIPSTNTSLASYRIESTASPTAITGTVVPTANTWASFDVTATCRAAGSLRLRGRTGADSGTVTDGDVIYLRAITVEQIAMSACLYADGVDDYLKTAAFALAQPTTVYAAWKPVTRTFPGDSLMDGGVVSSLRFESDSAADSWRIFAGASLQTTFPVATNAIATAVLNGAASAIRRNRVAAVTGNAGTTAMNGFTLGAQADATNFGNITVSEIIIYAAAHDTQTQDRITLYAGRKWRIAV